MNKYREFFEGKPNQNGGISAPVQSSQETGCWFDLNKLVCLDTETTNGSGGGSLDCFDPDSNIALIQTKINGKIELHDNTPETINWLKSLQEDGYTFAIHNSEFDINFIRAKTGLVLYRVYDTMIASQLLMAGRTIIDDSTLLSHKVEKKKSDEWSEHLDMISDEDQAYIQVKEKKHSQNSHSLQAVVHRFAGASILKDVANSDWTKRPLTPDQIRYAENDVRYMDVVVRNQLKKAQQLGLMKTFQLEMEVAPVTAAMKFRGFLFDKKGWLEQTEEYAEEAKILKADLNQRIGMMLGEKEVENVTALFGAVSMKFEVSSNAQLVKFLAKMGIKAEKADSKVLESHIDDLPILTEVLKWREVDKLASTYGHDFIKKTHPETGRIHGRMDQAGAATGRYKSSNPNLQNIPPDMLKGKARADRGFILMTADYSSVESRILAYASGDEAFINSVNSGDIHSENARKIFKIPEDMPIDPDMRKKAKGLSFGIPYGISAGGIVGGGYANTMKEGQELIDMFYAAFPKVKAFLDHSAQEALTTHKTQDAFGRIRFYDIPDPKSVDPKLYNMIVAGVERQAKNHKIQSLSASITKRALADCWTYLRETGYGYIVLTVHDSIFFELKEEHAVKAIKEIHRIMEESGGKIMNNLVVPVDYDLGIQVKVKDPISGTTFKQYNLLLVDDQIVENKNILSPDTVAIAKRYHLEDLLHSDPEAFILKIKPLIDGENDEWKDKNKKWIKSFNKIHESKFESDQDIF